MEKETKGFGLSTLSVNNRKTVFLITMIILLGGLMAYTSMPKENFQNCKSLKFISELPSQVHLRNTCLKR